MSELIYDVQNKTFLTGRSRSTGDNHEQVANMQANDDEENSNQVLRSLGNAFATLKTKLSEYLDERGTTASNKLLSSTSDLALSLIMPGNFNQATVDTIASSVHQYLVHTSICDWFTITDKTDAEDYLGRAVQNLKQIREAINKRVRPVRAMVTNGGSGNSAGVVVDGEDGGF